MSVPDWVPDAIVYQIFPDRFANGDPSNDPPNVQEWGSTPTRSGFQGGDLKGILEKIDYLVDLGVNTLYLNPVFRATSNHRYNTTDYYAIDPKLGTLDDFKILLETLHRNEMRLILDGVFNHTGRGFFAFNDVLENGRDSAYRDWYHIQRFPVRAYGRVKAVDYKAWWGIPSLPKLNTDNPAVRQYIFDVVRYWTDLGIDGWRLDVPNEIDDDAFWAEFREVVRRINPQAYLIGEIWELDDRWVGPDHFDGLMHYPFREAVLGLLASRQPDVERFTRNLRELFGYYPPGYRHSQFLPLGSHDTRRLLTCLKGDLRKARMAFTIQMAFPGVPSIYYGDEIGLEGGKDPASRGAFPWDESDWNHELRSHVRKLVGIRQETAALRRGDLGVNTVDKSAGCAVLSRTLEGESWLVALNVSEFDQKVQLNQDPFPGPPRSMRSVLEDRENTWSDPGVIELEPWSARLIQVTGVSDP